MRLFASFTVGIFGIVLVACAPADDVASASLPLQSAAVSGWAGDFVLVNAPHDDGSTGRVRGISIDTANRTFVVLNRSGQRQRGTFVWSGKPTSTHATIVLSPEGSEWSRTIELDALADGSFLSHDLDSAADPTGELRDVHLARVRYGRCAAASCPDRCTSLAYEPHESRTSHVCIASDQSVVTYDLAD